ncbi:S41 family peptidase [Aureibacter tunicatorum]|uniref:C-terminal processing protease CtpA/Prc n=1 Tax=Aureibacter tunicatorum TaxID=866807 RepID=A0AAE3XPL2_9BACT|nr:S41 family peptidase [Aureibacter tunicatorum]MDR6238954.1 C-terminal processing protease CtpA/Prc [Aureibacter tunicatorum]BDD05120.1 peptidase S41 [Aureibacter tunicatorum]
MKKSFIIFFPFLIFITACQTEDLSQNELINGNIYQQMDDIYLWRENMPSSSSVDRNQKPENYFDQLIYKSKDKWSEIYNEPIENIASSKAHNAGESTGFLALAYPLDYRIQQNGIIINYFSSLFNYLDNNKPNQYIGCIGYVEKNSSASMMGLKRGDFIIKVNNETLTNTNATDLLYNTDDMNLEVLSSNEDGSYTTKNMSISKSNISYNPFYFKNTYNIQGKKIGYLVFNSFIYETYDTQMQSIFNEFKSQNIDELILDLRYNLGGSVVTANLMADYLAPLKSDGQLFTNKIWNERYMQYLKESEGENSSNLKDFIGKNRNNLELNNLYIITGFNTASASELIINGLSPYMNIIQIGLTTAGKYTASIPISNEADKNWTIQPIVYKSENAWGVTDYEDGFFPDYQVPDDFWNQLGDLNEARLNVAFQQIIGIPSSARRTTTEQNFNQPLTIPNIKSMHDHLR